MARECLDCAREAVSKERWRDIVRILKWSKREYFMGSEDHFCSFTGGHSFQPFFFRMVIAGMRLKANYRPSLIVSIPFEKAQVASVVAQDVAVHGTGVVRQFN